MLHAWLWSGCQSLSLLPTSKLGPSGDDTWVCESLWISPRNSPARLGVSAATATHTGFYSQWVRGFLSPRRNPGFRGLSCSTVFLPVYLHTDVGLPSLPAATLHSWSSSPYLATHPLHPSCLSPPFLPIWMNVSSLTLWLSDFHTVWFSGSSGYFLFLNLLLSFWLCEETKCIYLCLHLGWKSPGGILNFLYSR